jgi:excinuclease ABC subunit B
MIVGMADTVQRSTLQEPAIDGGTESDRPASSPAKFEQDLELFGGDIQAANYGVGAGRIFTVESEYQPAGAQPAAIESLVAGVNEGQRFQTLLGITGSGKSATIAWTIEQVQRPTLILAPNKSLAAQLAQEMREFFPNNRVEYFVSYYDYYQPEAYIPSSDTYIEKDSSVNDEIDRLRHSSTAALLTRRDTIVVASVSCIYGMGNPEEYRGHLLDLNVGIDYDMRSILRRLVDMQYDRNDMTLGRGNFRVRGDTIEVHPAYEENVLRVEMFGDTIERITTIDPVTGEQLSDIERAYVFPATHYATSTERLQTAMGKIEHELQVRLKEFEEQDKLLEAQRLRMRTSYDLEMMAEVGYCNGIENYSMHMDGREYGEPPFTLLDYFPDDYLLVIDESHVAVPQLHGQYAGDRSRKDMLVDHGFRLPSARDNRPLTFEEVLGRVNQAIFVSATPSAYELRVSTNLVEQVIRPTGLVDPEVIVKPTKGQIDDLMELVNGRITKGDRVLVTTLTKKMAEDLTDYLLEQGLRVRYLHSNIDTIQRIEILRALRLGEFDVLVGINLLREGLDLPEVSLVCILDADKEGFLRSETSLIQMIGRAARNVDGQVVMYADKVTDSMTAAIGETQRRREVQLAYNLEHGINPQTIRKAVGDILSMLRGVDDRAPVPGKDRRRQRERDKVKDELKNLPQQELTRLIQTLEEEMHAASADLKFEYAAKLRDEINDLRRQVVDAG